MIDTHAHLVNRFGEMPEVTKLRAVILAGASLKDSEDNIELAKDNPKLFAAVGIHPQEEINNLQETINKLDELIRDDENVVGVGECGLDFSETTDKAQEIIFRKQIELAQKYDLPIIIHARKAVDEVIEVLNEHAKLKGVFHCYTGGKKRIKKVVDLGFYFGIDGNLTYEDGLAEVVRAIPPERLLLETDSPELTPIPHRGERNQPVYVEYIYKKVAEIWGKSFEETEKIIDGNAKELFKII